MVQILRNPGFAENFGQSLGTGLKALAESKIQELHSRNAQSQSQQRLQQGGFNKDIAGFLSGYAPEQQIQIIKQLGESGALEQLMAPQQQYQPPQQQPRGIGEQSVSPAQGYVSQQPQMSQQVQSQQQPGAPINAAQALAIPSRKQLLERENLAVKQDRNAIARERNDIAEARLYKSDNDKVLEAHNEDFRLTQEAVNLARENLAIIDKHSGKFPNNILTRNLPSGIWNDEDISLYDANAKRLAFLGLQAAKGNPTDAKQELQLDIKAGIDKPIATQQKLLKKLIKLGDVVFKDDLVIRDALENRHGNIPESLREKILGKRKNPLMVQTQEEALAGGAKLIKDTETGEVYSLQDGQWVKQG